MKIRKIILIILLSTFAVAMYGCDNKKIEVSVNSEINGYSPMMSSTPGKKYQSGTFGVRY